MHNRWQVLVVMALALNAFGGNNSATEWSAAAAISTTTTIRPPTTTASTPATSTTNPPGEPGPDEPGTGEGAPTPGADQETHRVAAGESLWTIAKDHLYETRGGADTPTLREVAAYWLRVVEANRDRLASSDPDLIYPGETIVLPPVD